MDDDFNSPRGIAVLQDLTRDVNTLLNSETEIGTSTLAAIDDDYTRRWAAMCWAWLPAEYGRGRMTGSARRP